MANHSKAQLKAAALAQRHEQVSGLRGREWQHDALCAHTDPEAFYPHDEKWSEPAKRVCAGCPVAAQCLAYALVSGEPHGVWGGLNTDERALVYAALIGSLDSSERAA